jgi:hypothetical protein
MTPSHRSTGLNALCLVVLLALVAAIYGSIPFYSAPVMGQLVWVSSFAQSFANDGWLAVFSHNFGYPQQAPIAFGLPGAIVEAALLRVTPLHAADAYSVMTIGYLAMAGWGAIRFTQQLGLTYRAALASAAVWLTMPMVWAHSVYSMLSIGIALLPFYLYQAIRVCRVDSINIRTLAAVLSSFTTTAILSVFMDGYTFVMFALATFVLLGAEALGNRSRLKKVATTALPICVIAFGIAYFLYVKFLGFSVFTPDPLDFFRGWGVDVTMLVFPTKGLFWIWDHLGLGLERNDAFYYGDASVWTTTFSLFVGVVGCAGFMVVRQQKLAVAFLLIAIVGTYLALGPSLKIHSLRPHADIVAGQFSPLMPAANAIMPTGSGFLSEHVPGFRNMRASYRWLALGLLGLWALFAMLIGELDRRGRAGVALALVVLTVVCNVPKPHDTAPGTVTNPALARVKLRAPHHWHESLKDMDSRLVTSFKREIRKGSVVAFVPQGNDFLGGYLAAAADARTYNVGGDKNVAIASSAWPANIKALFASPPEHLAASVTQTLEAHDADYVVVSFVDLLWDAHEWPPEAASVATAKARYASALDQLQADPRLITSRSEYFAVVSLR